MWDLFNCYFSGRHEYVIACEPGTIFLRCMHCGRRSTGWRVEEHAARARDGGAGDAMVGLTACAHGEDNTARARSAHFQGRSEATAR
jgi:hypothetical protein